VIQYSYVCVNSKLLSINSNTMVLCEQLLKRKDRSYETLIMAKSGTIKIT